MKPLLMTMFLLGINKHHPLFQASAFSKTSTLRIEVFQYSQIEKMWDKIGKKSPSGIWHPRY